MGDRRDKPVQGLKLKLKLPAAVSSPANPTAGAPTPVVPPRPKIKLNLGKPTAGATGAAVDSSAEGTTRPAAGNGDTLDAGLAEKKGELSDVHTEDSTPAKRGRGGSTSARGRRGAKSGHQGRLKIKLPPTAPSHVESQSSAPVPDSFAASDDDDNEKDAGEDDAAKAGDTSTEGMDVDVPLLNTRAKLETDIALVKNTTDDGLVRNVGGDNGVQDSTGAETQTPASTKSLPPAAGTTSSVTFAIPSRETPTPGPDVAGDPTSMDRDGRSASVMTTSADAAAPGPPPPTTEVDGAASRGGAMTLGLISTSAANSEAGTPGGVDDDTTIGGTATTPAGGTPGPSSNALGAVGAGKVVLQGKNRPYLRTKKPLKEVLKKVLADIRRKDLYGLFLEPVDEQEFPGYLDMIGGRENAMDLATMEDKIDAGRYKSIDQFEADVDKMIRAAQVFNPDDSLVHREAGKIKTLAEKHIVRSRPIVRTPSPSPEPVPMSIGGAAGRRGRGTGRTSAGFGTGGGGTPMDGGTPASGAGGRSVSPSAGGEGHTTTTLAIIDSLPPHQVIPEQMLDFPPNSDLALTVGWYLTGGKRFRSRKEQRAKEKWDGQWREWYTTGDRNLREADDLLDLFSQGFTSRTVPGEMLTTPQTIDWSDESMRASEVWQPAPTYTGFEHEERPPPIPMRPVGHLDYGRYQHLPSGYGYPDTRPVRFERDEFLAKVKLELRPPELGPPAWAAAQWLRPEEDPARYLKALATGEDVAGEAYLRSVDKFVRGAEESAKRHWTVMREPVDGAGRERKRVKLDPDEDTGQQHSSVVDLPFALGKSLGEYVSDEWRGGVFNKQAQRTIDLATEAYKLVKQERARPSVVKPDLATPPMTSTNDSTTDTHTFELAIIKSLVQDILHKLPLRQEILDWSARGEGLDLAALLHVVQDFSATGPGGGPPSTAAERGKWFAESLRFTGDMIVQEAKRLEAKRRRQGKTQPSSPSSSSSSSTDEGKQDGQVEKDEEDLQRLTEIRLNLLGLAKNVPVHELRPMSREEAARLPGAVRNLIKIVDRPSSSGGAVAPG